MKACLRSARLILAAVCLMGILLSTPSLSAQGLGGTNVLGWGPHFGVTIDPEQIHLGMHLNYGPPRLGIQVRPGFDVGFGDDLIALALNFDVVYRFETADRDLMTFAGAGLGANYYDFDRDRAGPGDADFGTVDDSEVEPGLNILGGIDYDIGGGTHFFAEAKAGLIDAPDLKLTVGWVFF